MSLDMTLEIEGSVPTQIARQLLKDHNVEPVEKDSQTLVGTFPSFMYAVYKKLDKARLAYAEDSGPWQDYLIGDVCTLIYTKNSYDQRREEMRNFVESFARTLPNRFVLSFQYEGVYAYRDEHGLHKLSNF
jgi:hypothetical protein